MGDEVAGAVVAKAEDLAFGAELAIGGVEEGVGFEGAGCFEGEAETIDGSVEGWDVVDDEFEFDFGGLHGGSIGLFGGG